MPNIKGKKFPYTKEGIKASKEYKESDASVRSEKYQLGGRVRGGSSPEMALIRGFNPSLGMPSPFKKGGKEKKSKGYKK